MSACAPDIPAAVWDSGYHFILAQHRVTLSNNHVIPVLPSSAPRWVDICLFIPFLSLHDFSAVRGTLCRLRSLRLRFTDDPKISSGPEVKPKFDAFEYALFLCNFSHTSIFNVFNRINISWSQLTYYTGWDWTSSYIEMFKLTPNMEGASLHCEDDSVYDLPLPHRFCHRGLRRLHVQEEGLTEGVEFFSEGGIVHLLSYVECPALETRNILYRHPHIRIPSSPCSGNLRILSIDDDTLTYASFPAMSMSMSPEENAILLRLNINVNPDVVPGLRSLTCRILSERPDLWSVFVDFVESRRTRLETLRLSVPFDMSSQPDGLVDRWTELCGRSFVIFGIE
ncbi:hypothetical protein IW261DRAFT_1607856 [Armillaria novae-zelandiae]|uniref:Uncharacterized protein n=1 Tax=Armillaria novae-zelandiae TaxID=153914 RepID=A0AA39P8Z0_9AGAR|nr:hypothetical protein IW261DRAFT_1607856 [Armillaria novae-zelandiae]